MACGFAGHERMGDPDAVREEPVAGEVCDFVSQERVIAKKFDGRKEGADVGRVRQPQGVERLVPVDVPGAGNAAVVLRDVHEHGPGRGGRDRRGDVLLLDVGVEGVVHHPHVRMVDRLHEGDGLVDAREEVVFEAVEVFGGDRHARLRGVRRHLPHRVDAPAKLVVGGALAGELADRGVRGADEQAHAGGLAAVDRAPHGVDGRLADGGRRADGDPRAR
jgi:hypothetical protein